MFLNVEGVFVHKDIFELKIECDYDKCKGACCTGAGKGTPLNAEDIERIIDNLGEDSFFEINEGVRLKCLENGNCMFFKDGKCEINDIKPDFCRLFPFYIEYKNNLPYIFYYPYKECVMKNSNKHFILEIEDILKRRFGNKFVTELKRRLKNV
jgi:Fe-S-cluster containining protein